MNIDSATGLPELPEGYFWRVRTGSLSRDYLDLRKKTWYGSKVIDNRVLRYYDGEGNVIEPRVEILNRAKRIYGEFENPWDEYYGDYPPKKLEVQS